MNNMISNEAFNVMVGTHPVGTHPVKTMKLYIFQLMPVDAQQEHLDLLQNSLEMICKNEAGQSSVILDCSLLLQKKMIKRFLQRSLSKLAAIENPTGLYKLIIVTSSSIVKVVSTGIIKLKKADHYTKICTTMTDAMLELK